MARAAAEGADELWITSDNPRSEPADAIIADMRPGVQAAVDAGFSLVVNEVVDRREAIESAVAGAAAGDLVAIAGKGHEDYQEVAGRRLPFSDRELARSLCGGGNAALAD